MPINFIPAFKYEAAVNALVMSAFNLKAKQPKNVKRL